MKAWLKAALTLLAACSLWTARAAEDELTVITSDKLIYDYKQKFALFEGNVVVVDPRIKITADKMTVFFTASNKVSAIKCEGHAVIQQTDKVAKAALATYDVSSGDIVLTGSPVVQSGKDTLTGDPIIFNRDRNTVRVEGTQQKPRLVIVPGSDSGSKDLLNMGVPGGKKIDGGKPNP